jgi:hypothetical protein
MATKLSDIRSFVILPSAHGVVSLHCGIWSAPCNLLRCLHKRNHCAVAATNWHDGQITKSLSSPSRKNIPLAPSGKSTV